VEKGTKLATYAARCIENEILMSIRANKKRNGDVSLNDPIGYDREGNSIALIDILGTECDSVENFVNTSMQVQKIKKCIEKYLSPRERFIITNRYGCNGGPQLTQREIAAELKISRSYVSRIEKKARKKLCFHMNNE
jgi:RNA polymerase sporulation-specific sigma factor